MEELEFEPKVPLVEGGYSMIVPRLMIRRGSSGTRLISLCLTLGVSVVFISCVGPPNNDRGVYVAPRLATSADREAVANQAPDVASRVISFDTTEGTSMSVDVSPDGETLVFDLLGDIYRLPFDGGEAAPLTSGRAWDQTPRFSPDGKSVFFVSDRKGFKNIWRLKLSDQSLQQVTQADSHILGGPNWSQDGERLLAGLGDVKTGNSEIILHSIDPAIGIMMPINAPSGPWFDSDTFEIHRPAIRVHSGVESADGEVFFSEAQYDVELDANTVRMHKFDLHTRTGAAITPANALHNEYKPQLSHDGIHLAYFRQYSDRRTEIRILNRATGQDEALIELTNADDAFFNAADDSRPNYAFTPGDRSVIFWHGGKIHRVNIDDGASKIIPFRVKVEREVWERARPTVKHITEAGEAKIVRWPTVSRDGKTIAFAATAYIWVMDLATGRVRRLTRSSDFEYMPALSPDGQTVAYVSFTELEDGDWASRLMVADIDGGTPRQILAGTSETYLLPQWSQDGGKIALIEEVDNESGITAAAFGWTLATRGAFHEVARAPATSEPLSWLIYARFVGFDEAGRNLLFSYPRSRKEAVLATARLDGSAYRTLATGTSEVDGITPAPDLNNLALTRQDGTVWVVPFDAGLEQNQVSTSSPSARRVSVSGGYYVNWNCPNQMTFGFGQNVYRQKLDRSEQESLRVSVTFAKPMATQRIAFTGARLITMSDDDGGGVIESGTIVLNGQRISAVGRKREVEIPPDAIVIDATGKTVMPGLLDVHYHRIGGGNLSAFKLPNRNFSDNSAIAYGVTTAWEPGGAPNDGAPAMVDLQQAGRIVGPRWFHSATGSVGYPWEQLTTYAKALAAVKQHTELGVAVLKEYNTPTREQQQWLSTAAHRTGLGISSHIESLDGMMTRIVDGYTGGDHPYIPAPFFKDVHELLRQTGYIWTPNIVIAGGSFGDYEDVKSYFWRELLNKHPWGYGNLKAVISSKKQTLPYEIHRVSRVAEQAARAARTGVSIGISAHNMPGSGVHQEMWYLWKGGLPIQDVLRAATIGNAKKLGLQDEVGSLQPGKIADLLVLDDNPLEDITNTLSLKYTVQGGVVYDSATIQKVDWASIQE